MLGSLSDVNLNTEGETLSMTIVQRGFFSWEGGGVGCEQGYVKGESRVNHAHLAYAIPVHSVR